MNHSTTLTIIDDNKLRGVIAPAKELSRERLADIIDLIEWTTPEAIKETEERMAEADRDNSWIPMKEVERKLAERMKRGQ